MPLFKGPTPAFSAYRSADQTGIADVTYTKVAFNLENYDIGGYFDTINNRWTPPAGYVHVHSLIYFGAGTWAAGNYFIGAIYKSGAAVTYTYALAPGTNGFSIAMDYEGPCNGTEYFEAYCYMDLTAGTGTLTGSATLQQFWGHMI